MDFWTFLDNNSFGVAVVLLGLGGMVFVYKIISKIAEVEGYKIISKIAEVEGSVVTFNYSDEEEE